MSHETSSRRVTRLIVMASVAALILSACGSKPGVSNAPPGEQAKRQGGTMNLPVFADPELTPYQSASLPGILVWKVLFNQLVRYDAKSLEPSPDLADKWELSPDGKVYTFSLHQGVKWHDGVAFTADDVVDTFANVLDKDVNVTKATWSDLDKVEAVDKSTVRFTLKRPSSSFLVNLGYNMPITPKHIFAKIIQDGGGRKALNSDTTFINKPIGTGPYKFKALAKGSYVTLAANPDYFMGRPNIDTINFKVIPDANNQIAQLKTGELDFALLEPTHLPAVEKDARIELSFPLQIFYYYVSPNHADPLFQDRKLRQAFYYALDRQGIINTVAKGKGQIATGPISPLLKDSYTDQVQQYPYDPAKAKAMLAELGWKPGADGILEKDGKRLTIKLSDDRGNPVRENIALLVQQNWKAVGIDAQLDMTDWNTLVNERWACDTATAKRKYQTIVHWWVTPPTPDLYMHYGDTRTETNPCGNNFQYIRPEVEDSLLKGRAETDPAKRIAHYHDFQKFVAEDVPIWWLYYPQEIRAFNKRVQGVPAIGIRDALKHIETWWIKG